jgi:hypothetical protein
MNIKTNYNKYNQKHIGNYLLKIIQSSKLKYAWLAVKREGKDELN